MLSVFGRRPAGLGRKRAAFVLATPALVLSLVLAGCSPEPPVADGPPTEPPTETSAPEAGTPSAEESPSTEGSSSSPSDSPSADEDDPGTADPTAGGVTPGPGDPTADGESTGAGDPTSSTWQEPEDPTEEGPTAAPELLEVDGSLDDAITLPTDVVVSLSSIETTSIKASTPGEYTGSAVIVSVTITNDTKAPLPVSSAVVSLIADDGEMGIPTWAAPHSPLQGDVAAGSSAVGTYVFMLDPADQRSVTVSVNYSAGEPIAVFAGGTP